MAKLSSKETEDLLEKYNNGDEQALATIVEANMPLVAYFCKKHLNGPLTFDELQSAGYEGLVKAVMRFDVTKGVERFGGYISKYIDGYMMEEIKKYTKYYENKTSLEAPIGHNKDGDELTLADILGSDPNMLSDDVINEMKIEVVKDALKSLTHREQQIILLRYGLEESKRLTQGEVAKYFDCSTTTIAKQEKKAIMKMRHPRNTKKLKDFHEE